MSKKLSSQARHKCCMKTNASHDPGLRCPPGAPLDQSCLVNCAFCRLNKPTFQHFPLQHLAPALLRALRNLSGSANEWVWGCEVRKALHKPGLIIATQSVFSEGCQPHPGVISFSPRRLSREGEKARGHKKGRPLITSNGRVISRLVSVTGPAHIYIWGCSDLLGLVYLIFRSKS